MKKKLKWPNDRKLIRGYKGSDKHAPKYNTPIATLADQFPKKKLNHTDQER